MSTWGSVWGFAERVPSGVWVVLVAANLVATLVTGSTARRRVRRAGRRAADSRLVAGGAARKRDTALTVASLIPAGMFWAMVLAGSFHGLIDFGREVLGWHDGWEYLVPGTLDGVSVTFALLAFRAVRMRKAPDRCYRVVWGAAAASATVNFAYEYTHSGHNLIAGDLPAHRLPAELALPCSSHHEPDTSRLRPAGHIDMDHADTPTDINLSTSVA